MIDRNARDKLAELLLQFRNGEITGYSLLSSWPSSQDAAISGMGREYGVYRVRRTSPAMRSAVD